jgi:predicted thioesterase
VDVKHLAATPVGAQVSLKAKVTSFEGRRVMFEVQAFDKLEKIGEGRHERFMINVPRFRANFDEKVRKLEGGPAQ